MYEGYCSSCLNDIHGVLLLFLMMMNSMVIITRCSTITTTTSSCGEIHNINFPFQLINSNNNNNTGHCLYDEYFSLSCENNNQTYLSLENQNSYSVSKCQVKSINYVDNNIRVSNVDLLDNKACSSLLLYSEGFHHYGPWYVDGYARVKIMILRCSVRVVGRDEYIDVSAHSCNINNNSNSNSGEFVYALAWAYGYLEFGEIENSCTVESMGLSSDPKLLMKLGNGKSNNSIISYQDIHNALQFGINVSWRYILYEPCGDDARKGVCEKRASCLGYQHPNITCSDYIHDETGCSYFNIGSRFVDIIFQLLSNLIYSARLLYSKIFNIHINFIPIKIFFLYDDSSYGN